MIIGMAYRAQSGKSLSCSYLEKTYSFLADSFAHSLKMGIGREVFGLTDIQLEYTKETVDPFWEMTPRRILQLAGTEAMRATFGKDIWVKTLERRIRANPTRNHAISDCRYQNEIDAIHSWGGIVVRIDRDGSGTDSTHISETELDSYKKWDQVIDNNGDLNHLYAQLDKIVSKYVLAQPKKKRIKT